MPRAHPPDSPPLAPAAEPASRGRRAGVVVLFVLWLASVLLTIRVSDEPHEVVLDLVMLVLGLLTAGLASARRLKDTALRLRRVERHMSVLASADVLPWECDAEGRILFVGDLVTEHFGYTADEVLGLGLQDVVHPHDHARLTALLASGAGWNKERWRCVRKDGTERWFVGSAVTHLAADGTVLGITGSSQPLGRDAIEEHQLSEIADQVYALREDDILPVFQPILCVATGRLVGAEALSRFPGSGRSPEQWFSDAGRAGLGVELELAALIRALGAAHCLPEDVYLSVNVGPQTLLRPALRAVLDSSGWPLHRLVLEITEHASITDYDQVLEVVGALREDGVRIAVDDAGAGYSSFRHILRLTPEIIKLDRSLIAGLHDDPALRALASAVVTFGREMRATVTAEGVETVEELRSAESLGIHAAQGYLFGRPTAQWDTWNQWHRHGALYSVDAAHAAASSS